MSREWELYHTSPQEIKELHDEGRFGKGIFFSDRPYYMTQAENPSTYNLNINEDELVDASHFPYHEDFEKLKPIIKKIMKKFGVSEEQAWDLLSENTDIYDLQDEINGFSYEDAGEYAWDLQRLAGEAADLLGYKGVNLKDETGISSLINIHKVFSRMRKI